MRSICVVLTLVVYVLEGRADARQTGTVRVEVSAAGAAAPGATVTVGTASGVTDAAGIAVVITPAGPSTLVVQLPGFVAATQDLAIAAGGEVRVVVELVPSPDFEEEVVVVASTRTGRRLEDQPTRVEVLGREEIEEKMLMTPGDIVMMLNEMGGLRVQATAPSIGAASVRVQGMRGRYTRFLADGLPLFGQQVGGLGLLQIPPMDLGQVEVIKGAASAFYGAGAMGGVVNLLARRPADTPQADVLFNQSTLGATDVVVHASGPLRGPWSGSLLAGGHRQTRNDRDDDGWADVAGYDRGVFRPRLFFDGGDGRVGLFTAGVTLEERRGGTMPEQVLLATDAAYVEALDTQRFDVGGSWQALVGGRFVVTARGAGAWQRHEHRFGAIRERDGHDSLFGEVAIRATTGAHTWVAGGAFEHDHYTPEDVPRFRYSYKVPGVFVQDDVDVTPWLVVSGGARVDQHSEYGTRFSPRLAALIRAGDWTSRVSVGRGFFAATPLTEETEAAGLSRLTVAGDLRAERGTTTSLDLTRAVGPATLTATVFGSRIDDPITVERSGAFVLSTGTDATTNVGAELLATLRHGPYVATGSYTYVRARQRELGQTRDVPLTPRHSAGVVGMWEPEGVGRIGVEVYYTGRQRLEANPFRTASRPYVIVGVLAEKRLGRFRLFVNGENLTDVRQTRWDRLVRPAPGADGRWTVDAWAPLDGRAVNGGVRIGF